MKLNFIQQRKEKNFKEKQDNKFQKTCYSCGKSSHFAKNCQSRNLINRRQINAMLREISNSQNDIRKRIDIEANTPKIGSNDDYYLIKNLDQLQKVLDETSLGKAFASTQKVNKTLNKTRRAKRSRTSYSYLVIDLDDKYNQKDFHKCLDNITKHLNALTSSLKKRQISQIVNKCEKALENDVTINKNILDEIEQQLNNVSLSRQKIKKAKKHKTFS